MHTLAYKICFHAEASVEKNFDRLRTFTINNQLDM